MKVTLPVCILLAGLAACDRPPAMSGRSGAASRQTRSTSVQAASPPAAAPLPQKVGGRLPPAGSEYRYAGRWAAARTACGHEAWTFTPAGLTSPIGEACGFEGVSQTPAGYEIDATCRRGASEESSRISLRFAESAQALLASGGPFGKGVGLVWCGAG